MKEHLAEIRSLRRRLEESIQTNDRLRLQLEDQLAHSAGDKGTQSKPLLGLLVLGLVLGLGLVLPATHGSKMEAFRESQAAC